MAVSDTLGSFGTIRTLAEIGRFRLIVARTDRAGEPQIALILDGPEPTSSFAVLARMQDTPTGASLASLVAMAVEAAFAHVWETELAGQPRMEDHP